MTERKNAISHFFFPGSRVRREEADFALGWMRQPIQLVELPNANVSLAPGLFSLASAGEKSMRSIMLVTSTGY